MSAARPDQQRDRDTIQRDCTWASIEEGVVVNAYLVSDGTVYLRLSEPLSSANADSSKFIFRFKDATAFGNFTMAVYREGGHIIEQEVGRKTEKTGKQ